MPDDDATELQEATYLLSLSVSLAIFAAIRLAGGEHLGRAGIGRTLSSIGHCQSKLA